MSQVTLLIHLSIQLTINLWLLRTGPGRQTGAGAKVRRVWAALSAGQLGWKVKIYIWLIDNICLGLSWRVSITTPWMWWMFWCRREATKWRETPNRGRCQASITRMTSEKGSEDYTKNLTFFKLHPWERTQPADLEHACDQGAGQESDQEGQRHEQLSSKVGHLVRRRRLTSFNF